MDAAAVRKWVASRRAAEKREREEERAAGGSPQGAIRAALALIALVGRLHGWPVEEDSVRRRENEAARDLWCRLIQELRTR